LIWSTDLRPETCFPEWQFHCPDAGQQTRFVTRGRRTPHR
jgi:hypothetical protein